MSERQISVIPLLHSLQISDPALASSIEQLRQETQHYLSLLTERLDTLSGLRGTPTIHANVDVRGNRLTNLAVPQAPTDAQRVDHTITLRPDGKSYDAQMRTIVNVQAAVNQTEAVSLSQLTNTLAQQVLGLVATAAPPEVEDASALGAVTTRLAREDHTHRGVNLADAQTITGAKTFDRDPAAPFVVTAGSAVVPNLDADMLDGISATGFVQTSGVQTAAGAKTWSDLATFSAGLRFANETIDLYDEDTFTITGTGFTVNPTGTARYVILEKMVLLFLPTLTGTSNATTFTLTGLPAAIQPTQTSWHFARSEDNGISVFGELRVNAGSTTIDVFNGIAAGVWTALGTKTLFPTWLAYALL